MRQCPPKAKIGARGHQHQVVRARRDGADKGKANQRDQEFIGHSGTLCGFIPNEIVILCVFSIKSDFMSKLDNMSAAILCELERDGRISNLTLADKVGLSPSA